MIKNKQKASAEVVNAALMSRTADTDTTGKLSLKNAATTTVLSVQAAINETFDAVGMTGEGDANRKAYASTNYVANGDSHKVAIGKLDAQAKLQSTQVPTDINSVPGTLTIAKGGTGQTAKGAAFDALSPTTTEGDIVLRGTSTNQRLGVGTAGQVLTTDLTVAGKLKWATPASGDLGGATGTLAIANGGTGQTTKTAAFNALAPTTTKGDLIVMGATDDVRIAIGTTGQVLTVDPLSATGLKWAEAAAGGFSYVANGDFEAGIDNVSPAKATLTNGIPSGSPTIGAGAAPSIALSVETTAPLRKTQSLKVVAASAWAAGEGFSLGPQFTVQNADLSKVLTVSLSYAVTSGAAGLQYSGKIGAQSLSIAIYDLTAGAFVPLAPGALGFNTSSGNQVVSATFQTSATSGQSYQVFVLNLIASTTPVTVLFDECSVSPQGVAADGRTITFSGLLVASQSVTANTTNIALTSTLDRAGGWNGTGYLVAVAGDYQVTGGYVAAASGGQGFITVNTARVQGNYFSTVSVANGSTVGAVLLTNLKPGDIIQMRHSQTTTITETHLEIARVGGASAGPDARVVSFSAGLTSNQAVAANAVMKYDAIQADTHASYSPATGLYTAPVSGLYRISAAFTNGTANSGAYVVINGVAKSYLCALSTGGNVVGGSVTLPVNAGQTIGIFTNTAVTLTGMIATGYLNFVSIERLSGPTAAAASESFHAVYQISANLSVAANGVVAYQTRIRDTNNAYSNGLYKAPVTGLYRVSFSGVTTTGTGTTYVRVNGVAAGYLVAVNTTTLLQGGISVYVQAEQTIGVYSDTAVTFNLGSGTGGVSGTLSFERTGN